MNQYESADIILEFLNRAGQNVMFDYEEIQTNLFPNDDPITIHNLIEWIHDYSRIPPLVNYKDYYATGTIHIKDFLNSGGFKKIASDIAAESARQSEKEKHDLEKSKIDLTLAKKMLKEYPYTKWFARISIIISIGLAILELIKWLRKS